MLLNVVLIQISISPFLNFYFAGCFFFSGGTILYKIRQKNKIETLDLGTGASDVSKENLSKESTVLSNDYN
jgi:hypothetical protein